MLPTIAKVTACSELSVYHYRREIHTAFISFPIFFKEIIQAIVQRNMYQSEDNRTKMKPPGKRTLYKFII